MDSLRIALQAAIDVSKIPFDIYEEDTSSYRLIAGDHYIISGEDADEYAIVVRPVKDVEKVPTLSGDQFVPTTKYYIYYPTYEEGDASVGMDGGWIIDFDEDEPDSIAANVTEAAMTTVTFFLRNEIHMAIDNALEVDFWQNNEI